VSDLSVEAIERALRERGSLGPRRIEVAASVGSTNDEARRAAAQGASAGSAFLAEEQTAGRGRGGHSWHSPPGENIYLSLIARPHVPAAGLAPVTLAVGAAVAELLAELVGDRAELTIKWPNDVLASGRKLAGVLVEGQLRGNAVQSVILGVGVNVNTRDFPPDLASRATSLALLRTASLGAPSFDRASLAARLILALDDALARFEQSRLRTFLGAIARRDALLGKTVEVNGQRGVAAGIDAEGRLLLTGEDGVTTPVASGEALRDPP
jgi:BirA family biotin operon repressor/biotin-[acetyl-CoA-carboxylase] ligase